MHLRVQPWKNEIGNARLGKVSALLKSRIRYHSNQSGDHLYLCLHSSTLTQRQSTHPVFERDGWFSVSAVFKHTRFQPSSLIHTAITSVRCADRVFTPFPIINSHNSLLSPAATFLASLIASSHSSNFFNYVPRAHPTDKLQIGLSSLRSASNSFTSISNNPSP